MKKIELDFCEVFVRNDDIVQVNIFPYAEICEKETKLMVDSLLRITKNIMYPVLIFVGEFSTFSKESREFSADSRKEIASVAIAYVINNLGHKIVANFYISVNRPVKPIKFFTNEKDALIWLSDYRPTSE